MSLPRIAYIHHGQVGVAQGYKDLLTSYGCSTTLIPWHEIATTSYDAYDLIVAGTDTGYATTWGDERNVTAVEGSGIPVVGLGRGGYWYFGKLGLKIGRPYGGHSSGTAIKPVDPSHPIFSEPYPVEIPEDGVIELSTAADTVMIYLYPAPPNTVITLGEDAGQAGYYPLVFEQDRYLLWGYNGPAEKLTEAGRKLLINAIIHTANATLAVPIN